MSTVNPPVFRIGTRSSKLALWQAREVARLLCDRIPGAEVQIVEMTTKGDTMLTERMTDIGDKGLFTAEIEEALLNDTIDLAVHSLKDLPGDLPEGLVIAAVLEREDAADVFVGNGVSSLADVREGGRIGTSSLRRQAQIKRMRPDIEVVTLRGNVETRLRKIREEDLDGAILACAGLKRLGLLTPDMELLSFQEMLPAPCQGIIAIETKKASEAARLIAEHLDHQQTARAAKAERAFLRTLDGGCKVPMAAVSYTDEAGTLFMEGRVLSEDGTSCLSATVKGNCEKAEDLGNRLAQELIDGGARAILDGIRKKAQDV